MFALFETSLGQSVSVFENSAMRSTKQHYTACANRGKSSRILPDLETSQARHPREHSPHELQQNNAHAAQLHERIFHQWGSRPLSTASGALVQGRPKLLGSRYVKPGRYATTYLRHRDD